MSIHQRITALLDEISEREEELAELLRETEEQVRYRFEGTKVRFEAALEQAHRQLRVGLVRWLRDSEFRNLVSAPIIYSMIVPMVLLDITISVYQRLCFPLYRIARVKRSDFIVIDRHRLSYLNLIEKVNCVYCGYVSGLVSYSKAIVVRTEQYWCPIKHARRVLGNHRGYAQYASFGDAQSYPIVVQQLRATRSAGAQSHPDKD